MKYLRDVISKKGEIWALIFLGINSSWYQNQYYLPSCATSHINFGPGSKTRVSTAHLRFSPQNFFWPSKLFKYSLDPRVIRIEILSILDHYCIRYYSNTRKRIFEFEIFFMSDITKILSNFRVKKIKLPPLSLNFWWNP